MRNKDFEVIEITLTWEGVSRADEAAELMAERSRLTVIAPGTSKELLNIGMIALLLADHYYD